MLGGAAAVVSTVLVFACSSPPVLPTAAAAAVAAAAAEASTLSCSTLAACMDASCAFSWSLSDATHPKSLASTFSFLTNRFASSTRRRPCAHTTAFWSLRNKRLATACLCHACSLVAACHRRSASTRFFAAARRPNPCTATTPHRNKRHLVFIATPRPNTACTLVAARSCRIPFTRFLAATTRHSLDCTTTTAAKQVASIA
mmetsp:Transcript_24301/g.48458  ORF Transcript_24301/g.48458 Transcript_24301/m.48458 type:complete len:201 (-) Transcript_24301:85-687(-)